MNRTFSNVFVPKEEMIGFDNLGLPHLVTGLFLETTFPDVGFEDIDNGFPVHGGFVDEDGVPHENNDSVFVKKFLTLDFLEEEKKIFLETGHKAYSGIEPEHFFENRLRLLGINRYELYDDWSYQSSARMAAAGLPFIEWLIDRRERRRRHV